MPLCRAASHASRVFVKLCLHLCLAAVCFCLGPTLGVCAHPLAGEARREKKSTLQKWLHGNWTKKHEVALHWFVKQRNHLSNKTAAPSLGAYSKSRSSLHLPIARIMQHATHDRSSLTPHDGRYVVARLDKMQRHKRRLARAELKHRFEDVHHIDDLHVLVYLDSERVSAAIKAHDMPESVLSISILDIFSTPGAMRLKLSRVIRKALAHCGWKGDVVVAEGGGRLTLDVRTATGRERAVLEALRSVPAGAAPGCKWKVTSTLTGRGIVRWSLARDLRGKMSGPDSDEDEGPLLCSCAPLLDAVVSHPVVRWVEVAAEYAAPQNYIASALIQQGDGSAENPSRPLWDIGIDGSGEIIEVADTGIDINSCFFRDPSEKVAIYPEVNYRHRKIISFAPCDFIAGDYRIGDGESGHGTHVAGTVAGNPLDSGNAKFSGVAKGAKIFVRGLGCPSQPTLVLPTDVTQIVRLGYNLGARLFSNSWGFYVPSEYSAVEKDMDTFASEHDDALLIFSSGNDPSDLMTPCRSKNMMCTGSHVNTFGARKDTISSFSPSGPAYDGRTKPEVAASGETVTSAFSAGNSSQMHCSVIAKGGTSMATAAVAGSAALMRQYLRKFYNNISPSAALLKAFIILSSVPLQNSRASGFGRLDLSLFFSRNGVNGWFRDRETVGHHQSNMYCFVPHGPSSVKVNLTVRAALAWTDYGVALEGSSASLVNDLDLMLVDSDGGIHYAGTNGKRDSINVLERIELSARNSSISKGFRVIVYGENIPSVGQQPYAVAVTAPGFTYTRDCGNNARVCPNNCSGHGICADGVCKCDIKYHFIDCSMCNEDITCNGHGTCSVDDMKCRCINENFADTACSKCKKGWYGPSCSSDCKCSGRGKCDASSGLCNCPKDRRVGGSGCFSGPNCEYCCRDFYGESCNKRSHWCREDGVPVLIGGTEGGYIEINGYGKYSPVMYCRWVIEAPRDHRVRLVYEQFNIEKPTDVLYVTDLGLDEAKPIRSDTGNAVQGKIVTSFSNVVFLQFTSGWSRKREGFRLRYSFEKRQSLNCTLSCAANAACNDLGGDFCSCNAGHTGWICESSKSARTTPININMKDNEVSRFNVSVNSETPLVVTGIDRAGPNLNLHLHFEDELCRIPNNGVGLVVKILHNVNVSNGNEPNGTSRGFTTLSVVTEESMRITSSCRYMRIGVHNSLLFENGTLKLFLSLVHNATSKAVTTSVSSFRLAVYPEQHVHAKGFIDTVVERLFTEREGDQRFFLYCSSVSMKGTPSLEFSGDDDTTEMRAMKVASVIKTFGIILLAAIFFVALCMFILLIRLCKERMSYGSAYVKETLIESSEGGVEGEADVVVRSAEDADCCTDAQLPPPDLHQEVFYKNEDEREAKFVEMERLW